MTDCFAGDYASEEAALADFDDIIEGSGLFTVYREVEGYYVASRPGRQQKTARIDRVVVPRTQARERGWSMTFGVEGKCSGAKIGPALAQAIDYTWCVFRAGSTFLYPEWIFLWPLEPQVGAVESVMAQNRIAVAYRPRPGAVAFVQSSTVLLEVDRSAGIVRHRADLAERTGGKTGSR